MKKYIIREKFRKYDLFILDCDGVIWKGNEPILSAINSINELRKNDKKVVFLTNNSSLSRESYKKKFQKMGLKVSLNEIYTSSYATALFLKKNGIKKVFVIGEEGIYEELEKIGVNIGYDSTVQAVVVGIDREISYWKIAHACRLLRDKNKLFIVTNIDQTVPSPSGEMPGAGSIISSISVCANRKPDINIGKPSKEIFNLVISSYKADPKKVLVIGDRLETDILGANNANLDSALVLTGVTKTYSDKNEIKPKYILKNLYEIFKISRT